MHVVLFEGIFWTHLAPFTFTRPAFLMASGAGTLLDKQLRYLKPTRLTLWVRPELVEYCRRRVVPALQIPVQINTPLDKEPALLTSARTLHFANYEYPAGPAVVLDDGNVVRSAFVESPGLSQQDAITRSDKWLKLLDLPHMMPQSRLADHAWDLLNWNEESIVNDFIAMPHNGCDMKKGDYHVIDTSNMCVGKHTSIAPGAVLDASKGPIIVSDNASIGANAVVQGPCYIGPGTVVAPLAHLRPGTSLGPGCKVGGEISNCILLGHSNKPHFGYLGDSYLGEWVNLGAGTTTSNLKNTYDEVSLPLLGEETPSGRRFLGSVIGDHVKTAVGTRIMTGSYIGYSSMIACSNIPPRYVPSYSFITDRGTETYRRDKAIEVMKAVYQRRGISFEDLDQSLADYAATTAKALEKEMKS